MKHDPWILAPSLAALRDQVNAAYPKRSKAWDGTIGDERHQQEKSDHNPNERGIVCAMDITHDPANGCDGDKLSEALRLSRDPRIAYCLTPNTRILRADLTWIAIADAEVGDSLIAFDEHGRRGKHVRGAKAHAGAKMRTCIVEAKAFLRRPCLEIVTSRGTVTASTEHAWLVARAYQDTYRAWRTSDALRIGDRIQFFATPWQQRTTYDAGWLAGLLDGEGCLSRPATAKSYNLAISQKPGAVLARAERLLADFGMPYVRHASDNAEALHILGGLPAILNCLGQLPTARLGPKATIGRIWDDYKIDGRWPLAEVLAVRAVGDQDVVALQTSTRTFIAEGLFSHNCIFNRRIFSSTVKPWTWRPYNGASPHDHHVHVSVLDDEREWNIA